MFTTYSALFESLLENSSCDKLKIIEDILSDENIEFLLDLLMFVMYQEKAPPLMDKYEWNLFDALCECMVDNQFVIETLGYERFREIMTKDLLSFKDYLMHKYVL